MTAPNVVTHVNAVPLNSFKSFRIEVWELNKSDGRRTLRGTSLTAATSAFQACEIVKKVYKISPRDVQGTYQPRYILRCFTSRTA